MTPLSFLEYVRLRQEGLWINDDLGVEGISKLPPPKPPDKGSKGNRQGPKSTRQKKPANPATSPAKIPPKSSLTIPVQRI